LKHALLTFTAFSLATSISMGCKKAPNESACLLVLFDCSVDHPDVRERYQSDFAHITKELAEGDRVLCEIITAHTEQTATLRLDVAIPRFDWKQAGGTQAHMVTVAKTKKDLTTRAAELLSTKATNSDIMSGFVLADKVFNGEKAQGFAQKKLVVLTDAIEQTPRYDFTRDEELSEARINRIVDAEKALPRLPRLSGVQVYMSGVNAKPDPRAGMTREKMAWVQKFWLTYVAATGGSLDPADYGPSLTNFVLHKPSR
jgi:hypothetical protein